MTDAGIIMGQPCPRIGGESWQFQCKRLDLKLVLS